MKIKRALVSVSDKAGLEELVEGLIDLGVSVISSGGTARQLARAGLQVSTVSEVTGAPEILDGRVKTIHPKIHGGILADRRKPQHLAQLRELGIPPIDLVVCNLYPFLETISKDGVSEDDAIEQIDIGGPAMVRAAAKNFRSVAVVVSPARYREVLDEMQSRHGALSDETRAALAAEAFAHTASYDIEVARWMARADRFPSKIVLEMDRELSLRYGENPHQQGAFYSVGGAAWSQHSGKEMSYTNILDMDAAWRIASDFEEPTVAIVKHTNPCGVATGTDITSAYMRALECDPRSAFGGIVAANREIGLGLAKQIADSNKIVAGKKEFITTDIFIAPSYTPQALEVLAGKKNIRVIAFRPTGASLEVRSAAGGYLVQDFDRGTLSREEMTVAGRVQPTEEEWVDLLFAWNVVKHVKSNSVVFATDGQAVGIGAGQMSRVEAVELAARRAGIRAKGAACATDGFYPFRDGVDAAVEAGARAMIQPGGSVKDPEVIAAADEHGVPMVLTGMRHFRH